MDISATPTTTDTSARFVSLAQGLGEATALTYPGPVTFIRVWATGGDVLLDWVS